MCDDVLYMRLALDEAGRAVVCGEVPVGAIVVRENEVIARAFNQRESDRDPLAHAELLVIAQAARRIGSWRLLDCSLYVTLEPCAMCAGALVNARVTRLIFGAVDRKAGFCGSLDDIVRDSRLNHQVEVRSGVLAGECSKLLKEFFAARR